MRLDLFSSPGEQDIRYILEACQTYFDACEAEQEPVLAYLPAASLQSNWLNYTQASFRGKATVDYLEPDKLTPEEFAARLDRATALYVSGGNTFWLFHQLHEYQLMGLLREKVQHGLPLVGFSAGAILCGVDVLTSGDFNACGTTVFTGLSAIPCNILPHYPTDSDAQADMDERVAEYHHFYTTPVLAIADGAYLRKRDDTLELVRGYCKMLLPKRHSFELTPGIIHFE
jgi:dipeptidase E